MRKLLILLALSSCTVNVVDKRLDRQEVAEAFRQRDSVIELLVKKVDELSKKVITEKK